MLQSLTLFVISFKILPLLNNVNFRMPTMVRLSRNNEELNGNRDDNLQHLLTHIDISEYLFFLMTSDAINLLEEGEAWQL